MFISGCWSCCTCNVSLDRNAQSLTVLWYQEKLTLQLLKNVGNRALVTQ